jgi:hypothetical protein
MAVTTKVLVASKIAETAQTTQYTATNCRAIIDKATVANTSANNETISFNLVASGDSASSANLIVSARAIAPGETYTLPELVGHVLEPSSFISTASSASVLAIRISGREVT